MLKLDVNWKLNETEYQCPYCNKIYSEKGISSHIWRVHTDVGVNHHKNIKYVKGRPAWNKGLTKECDDRVKMYSDTIKKQFDSGNRTPTFTGKKHSDETKLKISKKLSGNNHGGRCKWYEYIKKNGERILLQGTWEVRFAKILDLIDEDWIKIKTNSNTKTFLWIDENNEKHYYTPDFYSPKLNKFFEVKGYWWGKDKEKMKKIIEQYPNEIFEIVQKKELENYELVYNIK